MDLKARLRSLEAACGRSALAPAPPGAGPAAPRSLPPCAPPPATHDEHHLASRCGARVVAPGLLLREQHLPASHRHGGHALSCLCALGPAPFGVTLPPPAEGWLFLDTETTGLAGGTGTLVFLFGGVHFDGQRFHLQQWLLTRFAGEAALLDAVATACATCALLVSFNGKSFDLPLLRTRMRLHGRQLDERRLAHLDLLHPARSAFARRWPDVRLQTAERRLCDVRRGDDLPGSEAPAAFHAWMRHGSGDGLVRVLQHHRDDVLSLVSLCSALAGAYRHPLDCGADEDGIVRRLRRQGYRVRSGQAQLAFTP